MFPQVFFNIYEVYRLKIEEETLKYILEVIRYLELYLSKRVALLSSQEIAEALKKLSEYKKVSEKLVEEPILGTRLFKRIRKYLSTHLSKLDVELDGILLQYALPLIMSKMAFDVFSLGKINTMVLMEIPVMTLDYVKSSLRYLKKIAETSKRIKVLQKRTRRDLIQLLKIKAIIEKEKAGLEASYSKVKSLLEKGLDSLEALEIIGLLSKKELTLKLLAYIEYKAEGRH